MLDATLCRALMSLNNPRRPFEASGTSGQKVVLNGGSFHLDGWWAETYDGLNGFEHTPTEPVEDTNCLTRMVVLRAAEVQQVGVHDVGCLRNNGLQIAVRGDRLGVHGFDGVVKVGLRRLLEAELAGQRRILALLDRFVGAQIVRREDLLEGLVKGISA